MKRSSLVIIIAFLTELFLPGQEPVFPLRYSFSSYQQLKRETLFNLDRNTLGPIVNSAPADCIQIDPGYSGRMYVGFSSDKIWKITNNGLSWRPALKEKPSLGIGDFSIAPSNPEIIDPGTSDNLKKPGSFTVRGDETSIIHIAGTSGNTQVKVIS